MINKKSYFRTDGIRGRANQFPMTTDIAMRVAMATALVIKDKAGENERTNRILIGKDTRLSGYMFEQAITAGFLSMGLDVVQVGPIPTAGVAMLTRSMRADLGVMITASHNKFQDNGLKLFGPDGYKLCNDTQKKIEELIETDFTAHLSPPEECGKAKRLDDALGRYVEHVKSSYPKGETLAGIKIVLDCANGAAYKVAPQIFWELEAEVITIGTEPNGRNLNQGCGATDLKALQCRVINEEANIGIALDGDADRLIIVDEKGQVLDGDQLTASLALAFKRQDELIDNKVVATVMSNMGMETALEDHGISIIRTAVGDRAIMHKMRANGFALGGEQSGHIIINKYSTTGDGILAALQVLAILRETGKPASEALNVFSPYPQLLQNVQGITSEALEQKTVQNAISAAQNNLANQGRILVRPSGTEPVIRVMAEGQDQSLIGQIVHDLCQVIEGAAHA